MNWTGRARQHTPRCVLAGVIAGVWLGAAGTVFVAGNYFLGAAFVWGGLFLLAVAVVATERPH